jgi:hypothetical protein
VTTKEPKGCKDEKLRDAPISHRIHVCYIWQHLPSIYRIPPILTYIYTINGMGIEIEQRENHRFVCGFSSAMSHLTGGYIPMISPFNPQ